MHIWRWSFTVSKAACENNHQLLRNRACLFVKRTEKCSSEREIPILTPPPNGIMATLGRLFEKFRLFFYKEKMWWRQKNILKLAWREARKGHPTCQARSQLLRPRQRGIGGPTRRAEGIAKDVRVLLQHRSIGEICSCQVQSRTNLLRYNML